VAALLSRQQRWYIAVLGGCKGRKIQWDTLAGTRSTVLLWLLLSTAKSAIGSVWVVHTVLFFLFLSSCLAACTYDERVRTFSVLLFCLEALDEQFKFFSFLRRALLGFVLQGPVI